MFRAPPGRVILSADYKHMELRVMAFLARERVLWGPLCDERRDPFRDMAAMWLRCCPDQVPHLYPSTPSELPPPPTPHTQEHHAPQGHHVFSYKWLHTVNV